MEERWRSVNWTLSAKQTNADGFKICVVKLNEKEEEEDLVMKHISEIV